MIVPDVFDTSYKWDSRDQHWEFLSRALGACDYWESNGRANLEQ